MTIDANFYSSSAEAQIHIIGHAENRESAKAIIMSRLSVWLNSQRTSSNNTGNNGVQSGHAASNLPAYPNGELKGDLRTPSDDTSGEEGDALKPFIPSQFSAQFADQFSVLPPHLQGNKSGTLTADEYMARLRYDIDHNHSKHTHSADPTFPGGPTSTSAAEEELTRTPSGAYLIIIQYILCSVSYIN